MEKYIANLDEYNAIKMASEFNQFDFNNDSKCILKFDNNISCTPFGMLLIGDSIRSFRNNYNQNDFFIRLNKEAESINYAGHMGFFKFISEDIPFGKNPGDAIGNNNYIPITKVDFCNYRKNPYFKYSEPLTYIEYEAGNLANVLAQKNMELEKLFKYLIREMIRNSQEHGQTDCAWICGQNWKSKNKAEIAILDNGIGYKNSLIKKYKNIENDEMAIRYALKPGVTESYISKFSLEDENSGFGLYVASEVCDMLNGSFSILSGEAFLKKKGGSIVTYGTYMNGSIIKLSVDTSIKFNYHELLKKIVDKGEKLLKANTASELSKGKFIIK